MTFMRLISLFGLWAILLSACAPAPVLPPPTITEPAASATALLPSPPAPLPTFEPSATILPTLTTAPMPNDTPTPHYIVDYTILQGKVNVEKASCRYGPGPMYLYLYGLRQGAIQQVIGRTDTGSWVLTQARGDKTRCWVKADLLDLNGDVSVVEPVYPDKYTLPVSPYYVAPYTASATRTGDQVSITWTAQSLRAGDRESDTSPLFVVETWVCRAGQLVFTPLGTEVEIATVTDEPGCAEPSHGRVFLAEKHGYAGPTEIPWPAP